MTVAKGIPEHIFNRNFILNTYEETIFDLQRAHDLFTDSLKSRLYDIEHSKEFDDEEKRTQSIPFVDELIKKEERAIRIRRGIFIAIYSALEIFLSELCSFYDIKIPKKPNNSKNAFAHDYYNAIYNKNKWGKNETLKGLQELRNYMTHNDLKKSRINSIKKLIKIKDDWNIKSNGTEFYFDDYKTILGVIDFFKHLLNELEDYLQTKH